MGDINYWEQFKTKNAKLIFIHTPKCGGNYVAPILNNLQIINKHHKQAVKNEGVNFTVIREPISRFESLLNYRLGEKSPRHDWPKHLSYVYENKNITLNEIVSKMSDSEILGFKPYRSLVYWSKNVDILITIDKLHSLLKFFGYDYEEKVYIKQNVSAKTRGILNEENRSRIARLFNADVILFNNIVNKS